MSYLRIRKFWDYQNADAWKKSSENKRGPKHPQWCKLYVYRDEALDQQPCHVRLVWFELLRLATANANAISNESEAIAKQISMPRKQVREAIDKLVEGGWIQVSKTSRRSRNLSRENLETKPPKTVRRTERTTAVTTAFETNGSTPDNGFGLEGAILELVGGLSDRDPGTLGVVRALVKRHRLGEGHVRTAIEASRGKGVRSPTSVAIAELKKQADIR